MSHRALPLLALRAFEAAARHCSYSRAAQELCLTHGAVGHHIRSLEDLLGVTLFQRRGDKMILSESGQRLAVHTSLGLRHLSQGFDEVRARFRLSGIVNISVLPSFAARWLIPRMHAFQQNFPDIDVRIHASHLLVDFATDDVDFALRYGPGGWHGLQADRLFGEEVFPVCSPAFLQRHPVETASDLLQLPLLRDPRIPWNKWFACVELRVDDDVAKGTAYTDAGLVLEAAIAGHGVALGRSVLAADSLSAGALVRLLKASVPADFSYYIAFPQGKELSRPAQLLHSWLLKNAASCPQALFSPTAPEALAL